MSDLLIILLIVLTLPLAVYSILNISKALRALRFPRPFVPLGVSFIAGTAIYLIILFLYLNGILGKYGWPLFIYPIISAALSIYGIYMARRKLHAI